MKLIPGLTLLVLIVSSSVFADSELWKHNILVCVSPGLFSTADSDTRINAATDDEGLERTVEFTDGIGEKTRLGTSKCAIEERTEEGREKKFLICNSDDNWRSIEVDLTACYAQTPVFIGNAGQCYYDGIYIARRGVKVFSYTEKVECRIY